MVKINSGLFLGFDKTFKFFIEILHYSSENRFFDENYIFSKEILEPAAEIINLSNKTFFKFNIC